MSYRPHSFYRLCPEDCHTCTKPACLAQADCAGFAKPPLAAQQPQQAQQSIAPRDPGIDRGDW